MDFSSSVRFRFGFEKTAGSVRFRFLFSFEKKTVGSVRFYL